MLRPPTIHHRMPTSLSETGCSATPQTDCKTRFLAQIVEKCFDFRCRAQKQFLDSPLGRRVAAALIPRLFGNSQTTRAPPVAVLCREDKSTPAGLKNKAPLPQNLAPFQKILLVCESLFGSKSSHTARTRLFRTHAHRIFPGDQNLLAFYCD